MPPLLTHGSISNSGHFYFGYLGHYHFGVTEYIRVGNKYDGKQKLVIDFYLNYAFTGNFFLKHISGNIQRVNLEV
jgi:hypothetical protein